MAITLFAKGVLAEDATSGGSTIKPLVRDQRINTRIENIESKVDSRIASIREKQASREAALKTKLQAFRDQRKAQVAGRVNTNLGSINKNRTDEMLKNLDRLTQILDKLEGRVNSATPDIKDPAAAKLAIATARTSIASAAAAVKLQADKDYTIQVSSETAVRKDAKTARDNLHGDLQSVRKLVIDAKQSVSNAIVVARTGHLPSATSSAVRKEGTSSGRE